MGRPKKIKELVEINGKVETFQPTTLAQIWGDTGKDKYGTLDVSEYEQKLKSMNKSDLQAHARSLGIMPDDNYDLLKRKLKQEFLLHINEYRLPSPPPSKGKSALTPEVAKILAEGK
jgi:hypothetical protein